MLRIVTLLEDVLTNLVQQDNFLNLSIVGTNLAFVGEKVFRYFFTLFYPNGCIMGLCLIFTEPLPCR